MTTAAAAAPLNARTQRLLSGPVVQTMLALAWPTIIVQIAQASTGLIETFWIAKLGTDALAGMAIVFPAVMLMQMVSGGAMGGGISSAIARALGAGKRDEADALVAHAIVVNVAIGSAYALLLLVFGPVLFRALGGHDASLAAALRYANIVFAGSLLIWLVNAFASIIRGTGNMFMPSAILCGGIVLLVPLSPCLIFGIGPFPKLGIGGGAAAFLIYYACALAVFAWYVLSGRSIVRLRFARLRRDLFWSILRVGAVASLVSLQTNVTIGMTTGLVGAAAGAVTETLGICAAIWPRAWLELFGSDPAMLASGSAYLHAVGPFYGFFGVGMALYFASQGAGRLTWPLIAGVARVTVAVVGGYLALRHTGSVLSLYAAVALALATFGTINAAAVWRGTFRGRTA
jgi:Na+-driven multidrug efflux pump